jgi:hypothetical protein
VGRENVASTELAKQSDGERRDARSEIERRRFIVAKLRWIAGEQTPAEIVAELHRADPPIVTSVRTVERDIAAIKSDARKYLTATNFDARFEVGAALARHELIARTATQRALAGNGDGARWARIAIRATEARTTLLQDLGLLDRRIGTLFIDDAQRADRIPSGVELQEVFDAITVTDAEITSEAELAYRYGDAGAHEAAARNARDSQHEQG